MGCSGVKTVAKRFPWKSGYRAIPDFVKASLDLIGGQLVAIGATKKIPRADIESGLYAHVGLHSTGGILTTSGSATPLFDAGKWSERNALGWHRKRPDWPMVQKTWTFESPKFGDGDRNRIVAAGLPVSQSGNAVQHLARASPGAFRNCHGGLEGFGEPRVSCEPVVLTKGALEAGAHKSRRARW